MHFKPVFLLATVTTAFARVISTHHIQGKAVALDEDEAWTLDNLARTVDKKSRVCKWYMTVERSIEEEMGTQSRTALCSFEVKSSKDNDCRLEPFSRRKCEKSKHPFYISGGPGDNDSTMITVEKPNENKQAIFYVSEMLLDSGDPLAPQTSPVEPMSDGTSDLLARRDNNDGYVSWPDDDSHWTVADLRRHINTNASTLEMMFAVRVSDDLAPFICYLHLNVPVGADLATWTWYDKQLEDCGYYASWGYMPESDAGIMTLVSPNRDRMAWFGFDNINKSELLGSSGPNQVYPL